MYIKKNDLLLRLIKITGKSEKEFTELTVDELNEIYSNCILNEERKYIDVPYKDKERVKLLGAKYDGDNKKWYIPSGIDEKMFERWVK